MDVEVVEALDEDRTVVRRLLQLYHYDFSEFDGSDVNRHGEYLHVHFDEYWTDSDRKAFLFRVDGVLAGLALVFTGEPHDMAEFFVMRKYRRRGVGAQAAAALFGQFPGRWTVRQHLANPAATAFWRRAIRYPFHEQEEGTEIVQSFIAGLSRLPAAATVGRRRPAGGQPGAPPDQRVNNSQPVRKRRPERFFFTSGKRFTCIEKWTVKPCAAGACDASDRRRYVRSARRGHGYP